MKKKLFTIVLCVAMLAIAIAGGTMAYFTDKDDQTNTFTAGKVDITLFEHTVEKQTDPEKDRYGDLVKTDVETQDTQNYHLFPGMTVDKDPTIRVEDGSEDAYLAAKVTVNNVEGKDVHDLIGIEYGHMLALQDFLSGGCAVVSVEQKEHKLNERNGIRVYGDGTYSVWQEIINNNGQYTYVFYVFIEGAKSAKDEVTLFEQMKIKSDWTNEQMEIMNNLSIDVQAFAVQANGFKDCYTAMTSAFGQKAGDPFYFP
ncbi:MAG: SipW-dependent-type signal peptide-containing protein [Lachnospiraceae bacterium]|nr:SipW-dependent-type signal peptide-containing protein [Lachnospiraceae bacterium]